MDEIQQPVMSQSDQKTITTPYVTEGLVVGIILALFVIGGMYYKSKLQIQNKNKSLQLVTDLKEKDQQAQDVLKQTAKVTVQPTEQPKMTPVTIKNQQDLSTQQALLDSSDMTSITKGLEDNSADSSQFAL